jgi:hypothetical protein
MVQTMLVKVCSPAYALHDHQTLRPSSRSSFSKSLEEARRGKHGQQQARGEQSDIKEGRGSIAIAQYVPSLTWLLLSNSSFSPTFIEHSTAGEGLPFLPRSFFTYRTHDASVPSTEASAKSKFCTTAHVEYTQSRSAASATTTAIEIRNGGGRSSDAFRQPAKQCVSIIISADTSSPPCTSTRTRTRALATET